MGLPLAGAGGRADRTAGDPGAGDPPPAPPLVGPLANRVEEADARALAALGRLYDAGLPMPEALDLAHRGRAGGGGRPSTWPTRAAGWRGASDLAGAWRHLPARAGAPGSRSAEEAGSLGDALGRVAEELRFGVADAAEAHSAAILPVIVMLVVGGIIAWRVFAFYSAYYSNLPF